MFQLSRQEADFLTSQNAMSNVGGGGRRTLPYVFTEHGMAMFSSVLNSERAVQANIAIMRAFVQLRQVIAAHEELARNIDELEKKYKEHDSPFQVVFHAIRELLEPPAAPPKRQIGFRLPANSSERTSRSATLVRYPERAHR
jgi:ORF6N domain